jgi:hypothetical protein
MTRMGMGMTKGRMTERVMTKAIISTAIQKGDSGNPDKD